MDRTERFYRIDRLLRERRSVSLAALIEDLGVSRATILRDLAYMKERLHAPVVFSHDLGGYTFDPGAREAARYALPGLWFNASEIHALLVMQQLLQEIEPELLAPHLGPLARRLERLVEKGGFRASEVAARVRLSPMGRRKCAGAFFGVVAAALLARVQLRITHLNRHTDERLTRAVSPQRLVYYRDNWYLDSWCHLRQDLRSFSVDAIEAAVALPDAANEVPFVQLAERFDAGYGIFSGEIRQWATLRFSPYRSRWVAQERWHRDQEGEFDANGWFILRVPFHDPRELLMDVLRHGRDCEVLSPGSLRAMVGEEIRALSALYGQGSRLPDAAASPCPGSGQKR